MKTPPPPEGYPNWLAFLDEKGHGDHFHQGKIIWGQEVNACAFEELKAFHQQWKPLADISTPDKWVDVYKHYQELLLADEAAGFWQEQFEMANKDREGLKKEEAATAIAALWPQWVPVGVPAILGKYYIVTDGKRIERAMYLHWIGDQEPQFNSVLDATHYAEESEILKVLPQPPHDTTE